MIIVVTVSSCVFIYLTGLIISSFILGRIKFIDWDNYERSGVSEQKDTELGITAMLIFWPLTMPVYMIFYTVRKIHFFGNELLRRNKTNALKKEIEQNKNESIKALKLIIDATQESASYRESPQRTELIINNVKRMNDSTFRIITADCTFHLNMSNKTYQQNNIQEVLNKMGVLKCYPN